MALYSRNPSRRPTLELGERMPWVADGTQAGGGPVSALELPACLCQVLFPHVCETPSEVWVKAKLIRHWPNA